MKAVAKTGFVADASVAIAWVVESQSAPQTDELLSIVAEGAPLHVPAIWPYEVSNTLLTLERRTRIDGGQGTRALEILTRLNPTVDGDGPHVAMERTRDLARKYTLTVYDAAYLELALRRRLPLASRDSALVQAAELAKVPNLL